MIDCKTVDKVRRNPTEPAVNLVFLVSYLRISNLENMRANVVRNFKVLKYFRTLTHYFDIPSA